MSEPEESLIKPLDKHSWFYKNCKRQRKVGAEICQECPFRAWLEAKEERDE